MMIEPASDMWPVIARWRQHADGGTNTWYLGGLRADRSFWGYVHYRTEALQESRCFQGTIDEQSFDRAARLIQEIERHAIRETESKQVDALVGIGQRSKFRTIFEIRDGSAEPDVASVISAYNEFRDLIQPILAANIIS